MLNSMLIDIWTLGSLFLDMLTWLLGGKELLKEFQDFVQVQYITGGLRKMFYQILELQSQRPDSVHIRDNLSKVMVSENEVYNSSMKDSDIPRTPNETSGMEFS